MGRTCAVENYQHQQVDRPFAEQTYQCVFTQQRVCQAVRLESIDRRRNCPERLPGSTRRGAIAIDLATSQDRPTQSKQFVPVVQRETQQTQKRFLDVVVVIVTTTGCTKGLQRLSPERVLILEIFALLWPDNFLHRCWLLGLCEVPARCNHAVRVRREYDWALSGQADRTVDSLAPATELGQEHTAG